MRNIVNGITALGNVNVDNCRDIGEFIMETMYNQSIDDYVYKRKKTSSINLLMIMFTKVKQQAVSIY